MFDYKKKLAALAEECMDHTAHSVLFDVNIDVQVYVSLYRCEVLDVEITDMNNKSGNSLYNLEEYVKNELQTLIFNSYE